MAGIIILSFVENEGHQSGVRLYQRTLETTGWSVVRLLPVAEVIRERRWGEFWISNQASRCACLTWIPSLTVWYQTCFVQVIVRLCNFGGDSGCC